MLWLYQKSNSQTSEKSIWSQIFWEKLWKQFWSNHNSFGTISDVEIFFALFPFINNVFSLVAIDCPESHPWAHANGTLCCDRYNRGNGSFSFLEWYDPDSFCVGGNAVLCPNGNLCKTDKEFLSKFSLMEKLGPLRLWTYYVSETFDRNSIE